LAVYTVLDDEALSRLLTRFPDAGAFASAEGVAAGSINTMYRVTTDRRVVYLRVNEGKALADVRYEAAVLDALDAAALPFETPRLLPTGEGATVASVPLAGETKHVGVFAEIEGRELAAAEVRDAHVSQVGDALARAHVALDDFRGGRRNPFSTRTVDAWLDEVEPHFAPEVLGPARARFRRITRARRPLPRGVVHGDLFRNNTKWEENTLRALFDWEMAGRDHLALDLGVCLNAWCFDDARASWDLSLARALVAGYAAVRPLTQTERRGLFTETAFAALRFTLSRVRDFELREGDADRDHLDYREYERRSEALEALGPRAFRAEVLP
jgi:homoserine kinase type II